MNVFSFRAGPRKPSSTRHVDFSLYGCYIPETETFIGRSYRPQGITKKSFAFRDGAAVFLTVKSLPQGGPQTGGVNSGMVSDFPSGSSFGQRSH